MRKKYLVIICILILIFAININPVVTVNASELTEESFNQIIEDLIGGIDLINLEKLLNQYLGDYNIKEVISLAIKGEFLDYNFIFNFILTVIKTNLAPLCANFITILIVILICGLLSAIKSQKERFSEQIFLVCYCSIAIILFYQVISVIKDVSDVIKVVNKQTQSVFPILLSLISVLGAKSSVSVYQSSYLFISSVAMVIINKILLPIIYFCIVIALCSSLSNKFSLKKLEMFFSDLYKWIIGAVIAVFSIFMGIKGFTASAYDNFSLRALKYAVGSSFPLIGGFAKEGVDVVIASSILIKNAIGSVALIIIFFAFFTPFLKIAILSFLLKFVSAIVEPISDNRISSMILSFSKIVSMLSTLLLMVFVLFFILVILLISAQSGLLGG